MTAEGQASKLIQKEYKVHRGQNQGSRSGLFLNDLDHAREDVFSL